MTDAPTSEMASGRKTKVFASASRLTRSNSAAMNSPRMTAPPVPTMSQMTLLRRICGEFGLDHHREVLERELTGVVWKLRRMVPAAG